MPRVDWQSEIPPRLPWTEEDVRIFLSLPIHLQATSIHADGRDAKLMADIERLWRACGYSSPMLMVRWMVKLYAES